MLPEEDKLFGGEAAPADQPKQKRRQVHNNIEVEHVDIQLPEDFGTIVVRAADKVTSDLLVGGSFVAQAFWLDETQAAGF